MGDVEGVLRVESATRATGAYEGEVRVDLGGLLACDARPVPPELVADGQALVGRARDVLQRLVNDLFSLPHEPVDSGRLVHLPPPAEAVPRMHPLPGPKPLTRWEQYAKEKGIKKQKRSKLVWDEDAGEWKRRHGFGKANDDAKVAIVDAGPNDKAGDDPFAGLAREKKEQQQKQEKRRLRNLEEAYAKGGAKALPAGVKLASMLPPEGGSVGRAMGGGKPLRSLKKDELRAAAAGAAVSTASVGKFDRRVENETADLRKVKGKRKKFDANVEAKGARGSESEKLLGVLDKLVRKQEREGGAVNERKAANLLKREGEAERQKRKAEALGGGTVGNVASKKRKSEGKGGKGGKGKDAAKKAAPAGKKGSKKR